MYLRKMSEQTRTLMYSLFVVAIAFGGLLYGAGFSTAVASGNGDNGAASPAAPAASFTANAGSLGSIPDAATGCGTPGTAKDVTFSVSGLSGAVSTVSVSNLTFGSPIHTWMGDVTAVLIAPNGASHTLFGRATSTTATGCGDSSDLAGPYGFTDAAAAPPSGGWWQAAVATGAAPMPVGDYRTTNSGGAGATNPMPATTMNPSFTGVANPNGTWTLRLTDAGGGDTGAVTAATLNLTTAAPPGAPVDYNGDGKTDFSVVRNTGGGSGGQVTWFNCINGVSEPGCYDIRAWGISTDFFVPEDYDGDNKTDIAVWRPGASTVAAFYILQSQTSTLRTELFGQTGDDPTVVGDYNGDGQADVAVYRAGAASGDQSTWFFRTTSGGPVTYTPWGQNGDFPVPGDFDGDGKNDFVIQRNNGGGQARFWQLFSNGSTGSVVFGTPTDVVVPGDYDGDGKADIATVRGISGSINWFVLPSSTGVISAIPYAVFGTSATDFPAQGDYDGDGKIDVAIWRPNADPTLNFFYFLGSTSGVGRFEWGANGDYPVANYNAH